MARTKTPAKQKQLTSSSPTPAETDDAPAPTSAIPTPLQFPILVIAQLALSAALYTAASPFTRGDLATISGHRDRWYEIGVLLSWKVVELAAGWWGGYDSKNANAMNLRWNHGSANEKPLALDLWSLILLAHVPYQFFLISFYQIRPTTALTCLTIDLISPCAPFYAFRKLSPYHKFTTPKGAAANRSIIDDIGVQVSTSLLAAGIYGLVVYGSFLSWLPSYLVIHFEGIRDISALYDSTFPAIIAVFIPIGFAAKTFLFTPTLAALPDEKEERAIKRFDPETATLKETFVFNVWGHSKRVKTLLVRTATLIVVGGVHTWLHTYGAVEGAEGFGAVGWSSVWALAALVTALAYLFVGDVEGVTN